jgi:hypothetical protein
MARGSGVVRVLVSAVLAAGVALAGLACGGADDVEIQSPVLTYASAEQALRSPTADAHAQNRDCSLVLCLAVECPAGFTRHFTPAQCCGVCVGDPHAALPEGSCSTPNDCEGLVHIMCVGSWSCDAGSCSYTCDGGEPLSIE